MSRALNPVAAMIVLRIAAGLFFVPHVLGKLLPPHNSLGFFAAAGFPHPEAAMYGAAIVETAASVGLILGVLTRVAAALAVCLLLAASGALLAVGAPGLWLWNSGGVEYPLFWALVCAVVGMSASPARAASSISRPPSTATSGSTTPTPSPSSELPTAS